MRTVRQVHISTHNFIDMLERNANINRKQIGIFSQLAYFPQHLLCLVGFVPVTC